jgi:putative DNA primase/helicase
VSSLTLPSVLVGKRRLSEMTRDALAVLGLANHDAPRLFRRGGVLVRMRLDEEVPLVEPLTVDALRGELDRVADWVKEDGSIAPPPNLVVRDILSLSSYEGIPRLRAVAEAPFFARDGRLVATEGYDAGTGVFCRFPSGLVVPKVPEIPSAEDVRRGRALLFEPLIDFPFVDESSRAHAVALHLGPIVRDIIDCPFPLTAIDAPMAGTGKGLLADSASHVTTGRAIEVMTEARDFEELRKRITALLLAGGPFGLFDNVTRRLESGALAALLTADIWRDRVLGASRMVSVPNRTVWIATGNNLEFSGEILRRTVWIRIDAKTPDPHRRAEFHHDPLLGWILANRGELLWALLVLVRHWIAEGRPLFRARRLGSYEIWSGVIGGILGTANVHGFLDNLDPFSTQADRETADWRVLIETWWTAFGIQPVDVEVLLPLAAETLPEILGDGGDRSQRTRLGKALQGHIGWTWELPDDGRGSLAVRLEGVTATDQKGRRRHAWVLKLAVRHQGEPMNRGDDAKKVGTLGFARQPVEQGAPGSTPNLRANPSHIGSTLGEPEVTSLQKVTTVSPNVPTPESIPWEEL